MIKLNEAGLPSLIDLVPPLDRLNTEQSANERLSTLLAILQSQSDAIGANIDLLYQSWFIETCDDWTVPYIAKLIGLPSDLANATNIARQRALVANTLLYHSYRGSAHALSCAVQDASGWPVLVIEGIEKQFTSVQSGVRANNQPAIFDVADDDRPIAPPNPQSPDTTTYSIYRTPVTPPTSSDSVAIYYWRDQTIKNCGIEAAPIGDDLFCLDPAGRQLPLVMPQWGLGSPADDLPLPLPTPAPLTRVVLSDLLENHTEALDSRLTIFVNGVAIPPARILTGSLENRLDKKRHAALVKIARGGTLVLVDPELGMVKVFPGADDKALSDLKVHSSHWNTSAGEIGGGIYDRSSRMLGADATTWSVLISEASAGGSAPTGFDAIYPTLADALIGWKSKNHSETIIHIADNNRHKLPAGGLFVGTSACTLAIQAAQGFQPALIGNLSLEGSSGSELWVSGCYLTGSFSISGGINAVFVDCTLWPSESSAIDTSPMAAGKTGEKLSHIEIDHCISGPLKLSGGGCVLSVSDSIIDGMSGAALSGPESLVSVESGALVREPIGAAVAASTTTFLGDVHTLQVLNFVDTLIVGELHTPRHKFAAPADGVWVSKTNSPNVEIVSCISGMPGYAVLGPNNPVELLEGGSEGSEFGAWHSRYNAARLKAAHQIIHQYCPIGMTAELIDAGLTPIER